MNDGTPEDVERYAVIGNPVEHSLSPRIHALFADATVQAMSYGKLTAPTDGFAAAAAEFFNSGGKGLNVTVPFKQDAWRWVTSHDVAAATSGAVNTIIPERRGFRGCNTDGIGLVADLTANLGWTLRGSRVLLLGAGGAARGVLPALFDAEPAQVTLANRTESRAQEVAEAFDGLDTAPLADVGDAWDVVLNATSASMGGPALALPESCAAGAACYDLFYNLDAPTPFCVWAEEHGARACADGLGMLIEQAAEAFRLWRGVRPATLPVREALREPDP